jgi:phospholipase/lecithinase/hemolysin
MKKVLSRLLSSTLIFFSYSAFAGFINYLDINVQNESNYSINNISTARDDKGNLLGIYNSNVNSMTTVEVAAFRANFLGQLSQDLQAEILDENDTLVGSCYIHIGVGSYLAKPDFTGSECQMNNGDYIQINPRYEIVNNTYKTFYKFTKSKSFSRVIIFGDSMSDNGNLYKRSVELSLIFPISPILPISPPYYKGRFTNGHVWIELLSQKLNIPQNGLLDYAYAGASIKQDFLPVPNLDKQVSKYLNWNRAGDPYALYVVWIGANDLLRNKTPSEEQVVNIMLSGVEYNLRRLLEHGAKHILAPQLPDLSMTPDSIAKDLTNGHTDHSERLKRLALGFNKELKQLLITLGREYSDVKFMTFDVYNFLAKAHDNADEYGFKYIHERCNPNNYWEDDMATCHSPKQYVFWDGLHPSATAHSILAQLIYEVVAGSGYEPNLRGFKANLPDEFTLRNHKAISELHKDINTDTDIKGYAAQAQGSLKMIMDENIPLF